MFYTVALQLHLQFYLSPCRRFFFFFLSGQNPEQSQSINRHESVLWSTNVKQLMKTEIIERI